MLKIILERRETNEGKNEFVHTDLHKNIYSRYKTMNLYISVGIDICKLIIFSIHYMTSHYLGKKCIR